MERSRKPPGANVLRLLSSPGANDPGSKSSLDPTGKAEAATLERLVGGWVHAMVLAPCSNLHMI